MTIHHIVLWKVNPDISMDARQKIKDDIASLPFPIPQIKSVQLGKHLPVGAFSQGWEEGCILVFDNEEDLNIFYHHDARDSFVASCKEQLAEKLIFDLVVD